MRRNRFFRFAAAVVIVAGVAAVAPLFADNNADLLTSAPWKISGGDWSAVRTFNGDGTFSTERDAVGSGKWQVTGESLELTYRDGHKETFKLPLNPKGTAGKDGDGNAIFAYLLRPATVASASPSQSPVPSPAPTPVVVNVGPDVAPAVQPPLPPIDMLMAGTWRVVGKGGWNRVRTFYENGTFTTADPWAGEKGGWRMHDGIVELTFMDGLTESFTLPLDGKGTAGIDRGGGAVIIFLDKALADRNLAASSSTPRPAPEPQPAIPPLPSTDPQDTAVIETMTRGPWKFWGVSWSAERVFRKNGQFFTRTNTAESGTWKITNGKVMMHFADGHVDTLTLPLNPKGTLGAGSDGLGMMGYLEINTTTIVIPPARVIRSGGTTAVIDGTSQSTPPAPTPLAPAEKPVDAAELIKKCHDSLVLVKGGSGAASAFVGVINGKNYLVTNAHVVAGVRNASFTNLDGVAIKPGTAALASGRDVYVMSETTVAHPLEIAQDVAQDAAIGDVVAVIGNAEGNGVLSVITGRITGIGPDRVEIDAPIVEGNSGSPIIHVKSGKVIGVAAYSLVRNYNPATGMRYAKPVEERFGYRIDNVKQWEPVDAASFAAQAARMEVVKAVTEDMYRLCAGLQAYAMENDHVDSFSSDAIKNIYADWKQTHGGRRSPQGIKEAEVELCDKFRQASRDDMAAARKLMTYGYFKDELAEQGKYRDEFEKIFDSISKNALK